MDNSSNRAGFKSGADISRSYHSPMPSSRLVQSGISIEEEVQITVGDVMYILILHQEVVIALPSGLNIAR